MRIGCLVRIGKNNQYHHLTRSMSDVFELHGLTLDKNSRTYSGSWFHRSIRDHIDGTATVFDIQGPHNLEAEIHLVQLNNGEKWVVMGESFAGPKWIWKQTKDRLRMTITEKSDKLSFDLALPSPGKRNPDVYTMSLATDEMLSEICDDYSVILHNEGVLNIGKREDLFHDKSSRKRYVSTVVDYENLFAAVVGFLITRLLPLLQIYENLHKGVDDEFTHMVGSSGNQQISPEQALNNMIQSGESAYVEFKPAIWYDHGRATKDPNYKLKKEDHVSDNIVRTVAGFLNADGGILFIGVSDDGNAYGLESDLKLTGRKDWDGLENELHQLISNSVSKEVAASKVKIEFPSFQGKRIAKVIVEKSNSPVFMKTNRHQNKFYVRIGNATNTMSVESAFNYISQHDWNN